MKTPDEKLLKNWIQGDLTGEQLEHVETWLEAHPEIPEELALLIAEFEGEGSLVDLSAVPPCVEPPYPEFFNHKLEQEIRALEAKQEALHQAPETPASRMKNAFKWLFAPVTAIAMVGGFFIGVNYDKTDSAVAKPTETRQLPVDSYVYVPSESVTANVYDSEDATMIVLDGLEPIADNDIAMLSTEAPLDSARLVSAEERDELFIF